MINVARDYEGLSQAAYEYLDEGLADERARKIALRVREGERIDEDLFAQLVQSKRTLADGYYGWVAHLFAWEAEMSRLPLDQLRVTEIQGLRVVQRARAKFQAAHQGCGNCGALNEAFDMRCWSCNQSIEHRRSA